jgi:hypothetical protein
VERMILNHWLTIIDNDKYIVILYKFYFKYFKNRAVNIAKSWNIKVIIDSLYRISSSKANRKYRNVLLRYLDSHSQLQLCHGNDGKSVQYDDRALFWITEKLKFGKCLLMK